MNEVELLKRFRSSVPLTDLAARERVYLRLSDVMMATASTRRQSRVRPRRLVVVLAAILLISTSAIAWGGRALDVFQGSPAPLSVQDRLEAVNATARASVVPIFREQNQPTVIARRARAQLVADTSAGRVIVWRAPTTDGGYCTLLDIEALRLPSGQPNAGSPTCEQYGARRGGAVWWIAGFRVPNGELLTLLLGRVGADVDSLELQSDERTSEIPFSEGAFVAELASAHPSVLVARNSRGIETYRARVRVPEPRGLQTDEPEATPLIRVRTSTGEELALALARHDDGSLCQIITYHGKTALCGADPRATVEPEELQIHPALRNEDARAKAVVLLSGVVGQAIRALEVEFRDGSTSRIPITDRFVLFEVPPSHVDDSSFFVVGRDANGEIVARKLIE